MGFYFDEYENDKKQHINLSDEAWEIIKRDIIVFSGNKLYQSKSGFLNKIFYNFYESANASITLRCIEKEEELEDIFSSKEFNSLNIDERDTIITDMLDFYKNSLIAKSLCYKKGHGEKFRINISNVKILKNSMENKNYNNSIGGYLKAIFEEYALLSEFERERIFFKNIIDNIEYAINAKIKVKIYAKQKSFLNQNSFELIKYYVSPFKILKDKSNSFNYLVGIFEEINKNDTLKNREIGSFKIANIENIALCKSMNGFISKEVKQNIEQAIRLKGLEYIRDDLIDVTVKFTHKGFEEFNMLGTFMCDTFKCIDKEKLIFVFRCTEQQAIDCFLKLCHNVEIIEPDFLRKKFFKYYKEAISIYS